MSKVQSILLIGPTGSGKTPLGDIIAKKGINGRRYLHFDFGKELRKIGLANITPEGFSKDEHEFIREVLNKGLLLEDRHFYLAEKIFRSFLYCNNFRQDNIVVLNGLPRHTGQAKDMTKTVDINALILLACNPEDVYKRIVLNTGGDRTERTDDSRDMIERKLKIFYERTAPLIDYYSQKGSHIFKVDVTESSATENIYLRIVDMISNHM